MSTKIAVHLILFSLLVILPVAIGLAAGNTDFASGWALGGCLGWLNGYLGLSVWERKREAKSK